MCFAIDENSAATLQVPGLDDLLEPMLVKRHGPKNFKPWGKHKQFCTQPLKSIENLGYQGQLASRMNIIAIAYIQQGLASLLKTLQEKDLNIDRAIQNVRDLYDMTKKAMDQAGRSGAFHHTIRRKAAVSDSGLDTLKDIHSKVMFLPLTGDGVFGSGLQDKLKCRKEQKEQLSDLVPEFFENKATKWKNTSYDYRPNFKQVRLDNSGFRNKKKQNSASTEKASKYSYRNSNTSAQEQKEKEVRVPSFRIPKNQ